MRVFGFSAPGNRSEKMNLSPKGKPSSEMVAGVGPMARTSSRPIQLSASLRLRKPSPVSVSTR